PLPGYGNGGAELLNHPSAYNFYNRSGNNDYQFGIGNTEALLRYGNTGTSGLASELIRLAPYNLAGDPTLGSVIARYQSAQAAAKRRGLLTTHSFDVDRGGAGPWIW